VVAWWPNQTKRVPVLLVQDPSSRIAARPGRQTGNVIRIWANDRIRIDPSAPRGGQRFDRRQMGLRMHQLQGICFCLPWTHKLSLFDQTQVGETAIDGSQSAWLLRMSSRFVQLEIIATIQNRHSPAPNT